MEEEAPSGALARKSPKIERPIPYLQEWEDFLKMQMRWRQAQWNIGSAAANPKFPFCRARLCPNES